jgi:hypothetical protein
LPSVVVDTVVVVVSGERLTVIEPTCDPSMQLPPPGVHGCVPSAPPVGQSRVRPTELVDVAELAGLPLTGTPPSEAADRDGGREPSTVQTRSPRASCETRGLPVGIRS